MAESKLVVRLVAENAKLHRELDRSNRKLKKFASNAKKHAMSVSTALAGIGAALVVRQFVLLAKTALDTGDALAKTSDKLGIATEQLVGLRMAAKFTGVEARTLDMALQRMTRRLAEAANGTGEAKDALKELGLDAVKLARKSPEIAFREISKAMSEVSDQSQKVRLSFKLFDSEGVALVNTLALGEDGLRKFAEQAEFLGTAITRDEAKKMEEFNDSIELMSEALLGVANTIVVMAGPALTEFINTAAMGTPIFVKEFAGGLMTVRMEALELAAGFYKAGAAINGFMDNFAKTGSFASNNYIKSQKEMTKRELALRIEISKTAGELVNLAVAVDNLNKKRAEFSVTPGDPMGGGSGLMGEMIFGDDDSWSEKMQKRLDSVVEFMGRIGGVTQKTVAEEKALELAKNQTIMASRQAVGSATLGLLAVVGGKSKAAALATIAIEKGLALAQAAMNTAVAVTAALKLDPTGVLASRVALMGKVQMALIAATGLAQAASIGGGTGGSSYSAASQATASLGIETPTAVTFNINALDTQSATDVIVQNRAAITNIIQGNYNDRLATGGPLG